MGDAENFDAAGFKRLSEWLICKKRLLGRGGSEVVLVSGRCRFKLLLYVQAMYGVSCYSAVPISYEQQ
jgi:hypothetical protein